MRYYYDQVQLSMRNAETHVRIAVYTLYSSDVKLNERALPAEATCCYFLAYRWWSSLWAAAV